MAHAVRGLTVIQPRCASTWTSVGRSSFLGPRAAASASQTLTSKKPIESWNQTVLVASVRSTAAPADMLSRGTSKTTGISAAAVPRRHSRTVRA